ANPSGLGQSVTYTATVTSAAGTPTGNVTFLDGTTGIGSGALNGSGIATFSTTSLSLGSHIITARYENSQNYSTSTSSAVNQVVLAASTTTLTSSANPSTLGQSVTLTATVTSGSGTPTGSATFTIDGSNVGPVTLNASGVATFTTSTLTLGSHTVVAQYSGDATFAASTSNTINQA